VVSHRGCMCMRVVKAVRCAKVVKRSKKSGILLGFVLFACYGVEDWAGWTAV